MNQRDGTMLLACIMFAAHGCAAMKASEQPDKKNLGVLSPGTPRTHIVAELGAPVWTDEADGRTTDVFAFKQGYSKTNKASRALLHGAADVATAGLWEVVGIPVETLADGHDVQLEVEYDANDMVASVNVIKGEEFLSTRPKLFAKKSGTSGDRDAAANVASERTNHRRAEFIE